MPRSVCLKVLALMFGVFLAFEMTPASAFQHSSQLATSGKGHKRLCEGKTTAECCEGISYCGCMASIMGDSDHPYSCHSSPPK